MHTLSLISSPSFIPLGIQKYLHNHRLISILLSFVSSIPYLFMIKGNFCYDDKVAVGGNPDVCLNNVTMYDIFTHDYWGNDILRRRIGGWTHDSWRPLVTLSFRFNHRILSGLDTWSYHLTNILINCVCVGLMYYFLLAIFSRCTEEYRLLYTLISSSSSGGNVSKLPTISSSVVGNPEGSSDEEDKDDDDDNDGNEDPDTIDKLHRESVGFFPSPQQQQQSLYTDIYTDTASIIAGLCFALHPIHSESVSNITSRADPMATIAILLGALQYLKFKPYKLRIAFTDSNPLPSKNIFHQSKQFFSSCVRWLVCFFWVLVGLLCKETALTALVIYAVFDILLTLPRIFLAYRIHILQYDYRIRHSDNDSTTLPVPFIPRNKAAVPIYVQCKLFLYELWYYLPLFRTVFSILMAGLLYYVRIILFSHGYSLQEFANEMHNPLVLIQPWYIRWLAIAYVQSWALGSLILPIHLSHEHAGSIPIDNWFDYRNSLTVIMYSFITGLIGFSLFVLLRYSLFTSKSINAIDHTVNKQLSNPSGNTKESIETSTDSILPEKNSDTTFIINHSRSPTEKSSSTIPLIESSTNPSTEEIYPPSTVSSVSSSSLPSVSLPDSPTRRAVHFQEENTTIIPSTPPSRKIKKAKALKNSSSSTSLNKSADSISPIVMDERTYVQSQIQDPFHTLYFSQVLFAIRILAYLAWTLLAYAPASHAFLYVAFVVAERTLYFPSVGMTCLLGELFTNVFVRQITVSSSSSASSSFSYLVSCGYRYIAYLSRISLPLLLLYYGLLSGIRNLDWENEETLLSSNLRLYPTNNGMSIYGLGAVRLYKGDYESAEKYLLEAINQTTLAEPYIMLGQMYWRYKQDYPKAIHYFSQLENTSSPRKEIMQNLGLLLILTHQAPDSDPPARRRAEYLVLLGFGGHGYPMGHPNIGTLAANAACVRLLSEPHHYGDYTLAEQLFEEALTYRHNTRPTTIRNAAYFYAITGRPERSLKILEEGEEFIHGLTLAPNLPSSAFVEAEEYIHAFRIVRLAIQINMPVILRWKEEGLSYGKANVEKRLAYMGGECTMELLYW